MASRNLGTLSLDLLVKTGAFTAGMSKAERDLNKNLTAMEKRAFKFGQTIGSALKVGAVAATAAFGALTVAVSRAIDNADAMRDLSIRTGIATEKLSEYAYAARQTGTDIDGLSRGLKLLSKNAAEALDSDSSKGKLFEALGVNVKDAEGNLKSLDALLPEVADKFKELEDGTTKAALAQELFGKSGLEMIEFLNQGADGLEKAGDKAKELGIIISGDTAAAADEFNDKLGDLKAIGEAFALQIAAEMLPRLIELVDYFTDAAQEGKVLGTAISDLGGLFDFLADQLKLANEVGESTRLMFAGIGLTITSLKDGLASLINVDIGGFIRKMNDVRNFAASTILAGFGVTSAASQAGNARAGSSRRGGGPMNMTPGVSAQAPSDALRDYFSNTGSKSAGGAAKAAKPEVDKLQESYERMAEQLKEQAALVGVLSETEQLRYELNNGELAKLDEGKKNELLRLSQIAEFRQKDYDELQKSIKLEDEQRKAKQEGIEDTDLVIEQMQFELSLIGKTNAEREKAIALRHLDVNATEEQRAAVASLTDELIRASENQAFLDDFKMGLADAFVDFVSGAKSAKEAFGDFADELFKRALQFVADKAIDAMFNAFSGTGNTGAAASGGATSGWGSFFQSILGLFGGGRASGGSVEAGKFYRVNENGTEMFSSGGQDYLMTGSRGGMVTPANKLGGVNNNNTFVLAAPTSQRTQEQMAQRVGFETSMAQRRNS